MTKTFEYVRYGQISPTEPIGNISFAGIAQSGERQTEDLKVPGSIPGHGTVFLSNFLFLFLVQWLKQFLFLTRIEVTRSGWWRAYRLVVVVSERREGILFQVRIRWISSAKRTEGDKIAGIAQSGERQTEDLKVPGSIPGHGIVFPKLFLSTEDAK